MNKIWNRPTLKLCILGFPIPIILTLGILVNSWMLIIGGIGLIATLLTGIWEINHG